jgi:hypothetical protein
MKPFRSRRDDNFDELGCDLLWMPGRGKTRRNEEEDQGVLLTGFKASPV